MAVQAAREAEESARRAEEARKREEERLTREFAEEEAEEVRRMMREKGIVVKDGETLDKRALMQREFERKAKEQNEFEAKMNKIARNMDYLERARREEELPFLEEATKVRAAEQKEYFEAEQVNALIKHKEKWVADVDAKHRSTHLSQDKYARQLCVRCVYYTPAFSLFCILRGIYTVPGCCCKMPARLKSVLTTDASCWDVHAVGNGNHAGS